jgi:hypothetical protein
MIWLLVNASEGMLSSMRAVRAKRGDMDIPCGSALLRSLAEKEAELLQALTKDVLARHGGMALSRGLGGGGIKRVQQEKDEHYSRAP